MDKSKNNKDKCPAIMYDADDDQHHDDFVFRIDPSLLVDPRLVFVGKLVGEGSFSKVYEGVYDSKHVAVKIIQPMRTSNVRPEHKQRFQREVNLQSKLDHENVVKVFGACVEPAMFIITEFMKGDSLQKYLLTIRPKCLDLKIALSFALDVAQAMEYLHDNGIIHRDLKPGNLLLTEDRKRIKVGDFGLAREEVMGEMTCEAGTYRWMAPELFSRDALQIGMKKHYNHKVDVYSFSIVLWELLMNKAPFKGRDNLTVAYATAAHKERPSLENVLEDIVPLLQACWSEDPVLRPEFAEITTFLKNLIQKLWPAKITPPQVMEIEDPRSHELMVPKSDKKAKKHKKAARLFRCFNDCLSE